MIRLGVNVDHIATLRQVRGSTTPYPSLEEMVRASVEAGAEQITIHLREDRRHIQVSDLEKLSQNCPVPLNLEMALTSKMVKLAKKHKPSWICLVPEKRKELTTEGGLNLLSLSKKQTKEISKLQDKGIEVSFFLAPDLNQIKAAAELKADAIELHTGHWVMLKGKKKRAEWERLVRAAKRIHQLGMRVHAGHGLDYIHTEQIKKLPFLKEVNIGHFLVCEALKVGLYQAVKKMVKILK